MRLLLAPALAPLVLLAAAPFEQEGSRPSTAPDSRPASRPESQPESRPGEEEKPEKGIPVADALVEKHCLSCHPKDKDGQMSRISFERKSPEGWQLTLKRMIRLHEVAPTTEEAKAIVRYLADRHGLAREEAEQGMYEVERRVRWEEKVPNEDVREACTRCHTLGRIVLQRRTGKEWKLLKATHLAFFPVAEFTAFRSFDRGPGGPGGPGGGGGEEEPSEEEIERRDMERENQPDRADKAVEHLGKTYPLLTAEWAAAGANRREPRLEGTWLLVGERAGFGRAHGTMAIRRTGAAEYETESLLAWGDGGEERWKGKAILYAGHSWRGTSREASGRGLEPGPGALRPETGPTTRTGPGPGERKEVLLLSADWKGMKGRFFAGGYAEIGMEVELRRRSAEPLVLGAEPQALRVPAKGARVRVFGANFPPSVGPGDLDFGSDAEVKGVEAEGPDRLLVTLDVGEKAALGPRDLVVAGVVGAGTVRFYDRVDSIRIVPEAGLARVGGFRFPKQFEQFEAFGWHRGPDGEVNTADDWRIGRVPVRWRLSEFFSKPEDDDVGFVGTIDERGLFTPAGEGPNLARRAQVNNYGDVWVDAEVAPEADKPPLRARAHLLVTVPVYSRWDVLPEEAR
ncbi:MAG TPA: quinohemoprotein amine dehydrogenase subunit alpha [Planctomycetota bacterium]|nr:quinohemoprotein amine dehydrogenase subunit alpha [Planctomycetota bacterium]